MNMAGVKSPTETYARPHPISQVSLCSGYPPPPFSPIPLPPAEAVAQAFLTSPEVPTLRFPSLFSNDLGPSALFEEEERIARKEEEEKQRLKEGKLLYRICLFIYTNIRIFFTERAAEEERIRAEEEAVAIARSRPKCQARSRRKGLCHEETARGRDRARCRPGAS